MPTPNTAELVAIYRHVKANPDEWNQAYWGRRMDCGTSFCIAGLAAIRAGGVPFWAVDLDPDPDGKDGIDELKSVLVGGLERDTAEFAEEVLGITEEQSDKLFWGGNELGDIRNIILRITGVDPEDDEALASVTP